MLFWLDSCTREGWKPKERMSVALNCHCGSHRFKPLGIMEGYPTRREGERTRTLFLVNCLECGTTLSCNSLDYYLLRSGEMIRSLDVNFFATEHQPAT